MPINQFVNKQNRILKTYNLCYQQSLIYYKESTDQDEKEILLPKIMAKRLFDEVNIIGPMKILKMNQLELTLSVILHQMILEIWKTPHKKYQKNYRFD